MSSPPCLPWNPNPKLYFSIHCMLYFSRICCLGVILLLNSFLYNVMYLVMHCFICGIVSCATGLAWDSFVCFSSSSLMLFGQWPPTACTAKLVKLCKVWRFRVSLHFKIIPIVSYVKQSVSIKESITTWKDTGDYASDRLHGFLKKLYKITEPIRQYENFTMIKYNLCWRDSRSFIKIHRGSVKILNSKPEWY